MDDTIESQSPDWFPITISIFFVVVNAVGNIFFECNKYCFKDNMQLFIVAMIDFESTIFVVYFVERKFAFIYKIHVFIFLFIYIYIYV